jgi:hypothetical protein
MKLDEVTQCFKGDAEMQAPQPPVYLSQPIMWPSIRQFALWIWASPWSCLGLSIGLLGLLTGGGVQRAGRTLEFYGGFNLWFLTHAPLVKNARAVTFGHTILGRTREILADVRQHEFVHVRQYELWGPMFVPAYLYWWAVLWLQGKHPYFDNPFEVEAFREDGWL